MALMALLCTVFAASAYGKIRSTTAWNSFTSSLKPLGLIPARLVRPTAIALAAAELVLTIALLWAVLAGFAKLDGALTVARWATAGAVVLLLVLTTGVATAVGRHTEASCACFGAGTRPLGRLHLVRNAALLIIAILAALLATGDRQASAGALVVGAVAGVVGAALIIRLEDLADLFFPAPA
jgi:hypothetical protein